MSIRGPVGFNGREVNVDAAGQAQADEDRGMLLGVMPVVDSGELFFQDGTPDNYVRFAFCKRPEVIAEAARRLATLG